MSETVYVFVPLFLQKQMIHVDPRTSVALLEYG
jgi:hypothetical protein